MRMFFFLRFFPPSVLLAHFAPAYHPPFLSPKITGNAVPVQFYQKDKQRWSLAWPRSFRLIGLFVEEEGGNSDHSQAYCTDRRSEEGRCAEKLKVIEFWNYPPLGPPILSLCCANIH